MWLSLPLLAQVTIKEKVKIAPYSINHHPQKKSKLLLPASLDPLISSYSGEFNISYIWITEFSGYDIEYTPPPLPSAPPLPDDAYLSVQVHGTTLMIPVMQYLEGGDPQDHDGRLRNMCEGSRYENFRFYSLRADSSIKRQISAGDTLQFALFGRFYDEVSDIYFYPYFNAWYILLETHGCPGSDYGIEKCEILLSLPPPPPPDCVLATLSRDTVAPGDTTSFNVLKKKWNDETIAFPDSQLFDVFIWDGGNNWNWESDSLGLFIGADTSITDKWQLDCTPQGFKFFPSDNFSGDSAWIAIGVDASGDWCSEGMVPVDLCQYETLWVKKKRLTIVYHSPHEIWPEIPAGQRTNLTNYTPTRSFVIRLTGANGQPLANESIRLQTDFVPLSNGHQHDSGSVIFPRGTKQGIFKIEDLLLGNPTIEVQTDDSGKVTVQFTASQISGDYIVTAFTSADTTIRDTVQLRVRVPGFVSFQSQNYYNLVGGTCNHHGPGGPSGCQSPDNNHWGTQRMFDSLQAGLLKFYRWSGSSKGKGVGQYILLHINDMSLPLGGVFDISGDWALNYHQYHRLGLSVDIDSAGSGLTSAQIKQLTSIMEEEKKAKRNRERPQIHYGFFGGN